MSSIRIIRDTKYPAPQGLAIDEAILKSVENGDSPNTVRFYYFAPPAVVVGLNQDISSIDFEYIEKAKMAFGRRLTGGGTIIIGCPNSASQMGLSFLFRLNQNIPQKLSHKFKYFSNVIMQALKNLGLNPEYNRNSDITISKRKIAGNGIYLTNKALLFHSIILLDYDYETMINVLKFDSYELERKYAEHMKKKVTTLNLELKQQVNPRDLEKELIKSIQFLWNNTVTEGTLSNSENILANKFLHEKYETDDWNLRFVDSKGISGACFLPGSIDCNE
ncbi:MAG: lipoate--protein ligase family protein [Candidatus Helarchaeota archaeon]